MFMGKATFALIAGMVALLFVAGAMMQSLLVLQHVAAVSDLYGDVKIKTRNSEAFFPLGSAKYVKSGDVIRTGDGCVTLNWVDGTRIRVGPETQIRVLKCQLNAATKATTSLFRLDVGQIWIRVRRKLSPRSKFEIVTPTATAGVRGTVFAVRVDSLGRTEVEVVEGKVTVKAGGEEVVASKNSAVVVAAESGAKGKAVKKIQMRAAGQASVNEEELQTILGPFIVLLDPPGSTARLRNGKIHVRGIAELGSRLRVNGQPVHVNPKGKFFVSLPARAGEQVKLTIVAEDAAGRRTELKRTIRVIGE